MMSMNQQPERRAKMQQAGDPVAREGNTTSLLNDPKIIESDCTAPGPAGQEKTWQFSGLLYGMKSLGGVYKKDPLGFLNGKYFSQRDRDAT